MKYCVRNDEKDQMMLIAKDGLKIRQENHKIQKVQSKKHKNQWFLPVKDDLHMSHMDSVWNKTTLVPLL